MILGARAPACLEWARICSGAGWKVVVADSLCLPLSRKSQFVDRYIKLEEPKRHLRQWLDDIILAVSDLKIDIIIPTCEEVFYLSAVADRLSSYCRVFTSAFSLMHDLHHKGKFAESTRGCHIEAPETREIKSQQDLQSITDESNEWVFKPAYSRFASRTRITPSSSDMRDIFVNIQNPWIAQRYIQGKEICSFSVLTKGIVRAHGCYHSPYRVGKGAGIFFQRLNSPEIFRFVEQFGLATGYTGQVGFDFIQNQAGKLFVLECNPRATSGIHLFRSSGNAFLAALETENAMQVVEPSDDAMMVGAAMMIFGIVRYGNTSQFWKDLWRGKDVVWDVGDLCPSMMQWIGLVESCYRAVTRRCGLIAASTSDIEWDGDDLSKYL